MALVGDGEILTMVMETGVGVATLTQVGAITPGDTLGMDMATTIMAEIITVETDTVYAQPMHLPVSQLAVDTIHV